MANQQARINHLNSQATQTISQQLKQDRIRFLDFLLSSMEVAKDRVDRDRYCANFDVTRAYRLEEYKKLTGQEWKGGE